MNPVLEWTWRLLPEEQFEFQRRCRILYELRSPIDTGRRSLAMRTGYSEAVLRRECRILQKQGLTRITSCGAVLTPQGKQWLSELETFAPDIAADFSLEKNLSVLLGGWRIRLAIDNETLFHLAAWDHSQCTLIQDAAQAAQDERLSEPALRLLRQSGGALECLGRYYGNSGRMIYQHKKTAAFQAAAAVVCSNQCAEFFLTVWAQISRTDSLPETGLIYMRRDFARRIWTKDQSD